MTIDRAADTLATLISSQDWPAVATRLAGSREPRDVWLRTLAANLRSMREARPELYARVVEWLKSADLSSASVEWPGRRSDGWTLEVFDATQLLREAGRSVAIEGVGDGTLLRAMAKFPPDLQLGRLQEVLLIEPDPARLIAGLGVADLTGPRGAFAQERFSWYVGPDWVDQLAADLIRQPTKILPMRSIPATQPRPEIVSGLAEVECRLDAEWEARRERVKAYYAALSDDDLMSVLGPTPPRKPRVLLLTSQFTAVLQYSTYDTADAFRQLGWDVRVCTEEKMWHLMARPAVAAALDDFKPDLVFQIDHLRYELGDLIPANLPFVCWIQDHLTNLTSERAAATITPRDFVLTGGVYRYVTRYGYPRRQCIDMPKVSREPVLPTSWSCDREDLFYVSHWSHTPESIIVDTCNRVRELGGPGAEAAMRACTSELTSIYARGGAVRIDREVRLLVRDVFGKRGESMSSESERFYVDVLFQRLNNAYYRQQALEWAGQIAEENGLKLGIYGLGWQKHPTLAKYARGPIKYGPDLEKLTRESKILLQLEPYACYTHQRMLDALLAGGFAIIRSHPLNTQPIEIRQFLDAHVPPEINSVDDARRCLSGDTLAAFEALLERSAVLTDLGDVVDIIRGWQRAGIIGDGDAALPHLGEIAFDSYDTMRARVLEFVHDEPARRRISGDQRKSVVERLTYVSAVRRSMNVLRERLAESMQSSLAIRPTSVAEAA